jgi:transcriptional regulator with GAF, ATPase, and Fis domain
VERQLLPQLLVSVAQHRSTAEVLAAIVGGLAQSPTVVLARIWLIEPGDLCSSCGFRAECVDQTRCLHLVASTGNPDEAGEDYTRLDGAFRRFPLGVRKVGQTAVSGEPLVLANVSADDDWVVRPTWMRQSGVRTVVTMPLQFRGQVLGVLGLFDRLALEADDVAWLRVLADHAAASLANAKAFEEIETLKARLEGENHYLRSEVSEAVGSTGLLGRSPGMRMVSEQVQLVAPTTAAVLISGESGTGKEVVARALHDQSPRRDRPFIKVNCGAVPESLFESEFFGHAKGAFTGALKDKPGRFELANGGTLLLDELGEVPLPMQAKLLRVLQEQEVERVGETRARPLDVRLLAATNRNLRKEVADGRFRLDLYYRLSVFPIEIPPLRERKDDIVELTTHFAAQSARRLGQPPPRISRASLDMLLGYDWPGNVRELQNVVERAVIVARGNPLRFDLGPPAAKPLVQVAPGGDEHVPLTRAAMRRQERENLARALAQTGGKVSGPGGAAELLGMKPTTLASRLKALGLARA